MPQPGGVRSVSLRRLEGLWSAELRAGDCGSNIGVLVFRPQRVFGDFYEEGRIRGGDRCCAYHGTYVIENFGFAADVAVTRYRADEPRPVFPGDRVMKLAGTIEPGVARRVIELAVSDAPVGARSLRLIRRDGR